MAMQGSKNLVHSGQNTKGGAENEQKIDTLEIALEN